MASAADVASTLLETVAHTGTDLNIIITYLLVIKRKAPTRTLMGAT
jgi:hypothetical protein